MKLKKNWKGLVPEYFPEITNYIEKEFDLKTIKKKYPALIDPGINEDDQVNLIIKIVFSIARQIPSDWKKKNLTKVIDAYIALYLREFVWDCFLHYYEMVHGEEPDTYNNNFIYILEMLDELYKTKNSFLKSGTIDDQEKFNIEFNSKIYKDSRLASSTDSQKIINTNAKKDSELFPLSWEEILHGTKKNTNQCHLLKDYINKKFV